MFFPEFLIETSLSDRFLLPDFTLPGTITPSLPFELCEKSFPEDACPDIILEFELFPVMSGNYNL